MFRVCHDLLSVFGFGLSFLRDSRVCGVFAMDPLLSGTRVCARCLQCSGSAGGAAHSFMPRETSFRRLCSLHESRLPPARRRIVLSLRTICSADVTVRDSPFVATQYTPHAKRPDSSTGRDDEYRDDRVCQRVRGHWRIVYVSKGGRRMTYALRRNACGPYASGFDTCRCGGVADGR